MRPERFAGQHGQGLLEFTLGVLVVALAFMAFAQDAQQLIAEFAGLLYTMVINFIG